MADDFLRRVLRKLEQLEIKETELKAELLSVAQEREQYQAAREVYEREMELGIAPLRRTKRTRKKARITIADVAYEILKEQGGAMRTRDLVKKLNERGMAKGKNGYSTAVRTLGRDARFHSPDRGLWDLSIRQPRRLIESVNGANNPVEALELERSQVD